MNIDYWARRLLGKATCEIGRGSRLASSARILNARGKNEFIRIGADSLVAGELMVFGHGGEIRIGDWCFVGEGARIWSAKRVHIGNRVLISHNVNVFDSLTHPLNATQRHAQFKAILRRGHPREIELGERPIEIRDDAWLGAGSCILRGVTIGAGAIVGAGAVVTSDVAAGCIVVGNPARVVRVLDDGGIGNGG